MWKKSILSCVSCILITLPLLAQDQTKSQNNLYVDKEERIYVKASEGVYFFISDSPDPSTAIQMKSHTNRQITSPMYFDGHGKHYIRHEDLHEDIEITFDVYADKYPPKSEVAFSEPVTYRSGNEYFFKHSVNLSQKATDELSGVKESYYSINGAEFSIYSGLSQFVEEKSYVYAYYAVDQVGNVEAPRTMKVTLDMSSPQTEVKLVGDVSENIASKSSRLELSANDKLSGVRKIFYALDDQPFRYYSDRIELSELTEGAHSLHYYAVDRVGNEESQKTYAFFVDKTPPFLSSEILGDSFVRGQKKFSSSRTKMKITAFDNKSGVQSVYYSVNGGEYQLYKAPFYLPSDKESLEIKAYALDKVNNKGISNFEENQLSGGVMYIDLNGPELDYAFLGPNFYMRDTVYINHSTKIKLQAKDAESGTHTMAYRINGGVEQAYTNAFALSEEGVYQIEIIGYDNVNNLNKATFHVVVDNTGPQIYSTPSIKPFQLKTSLKENNAIYAPHMALFLSATDGKVGNEKIYYSINGSENTLYTKAINGFKPGDYVLKVRAVDKLGNEAVEEVIFYVE